MALRFVLGGSGSGKSSYLYQHILQQSGEEPDQLFFVVVPEQFTLHTQRELVARQERHGIMNIDVVSFQRLAYRIFDELGLSQMNVLEETGKSFVLRKVAIQKQDQLKLLKGNMSKPGYVNELKSMISELMQYQVLPEELLEFGEDSREAAPFRYRLQDIALLYQGFLDYMEGNYLTSEEILEVLAQHVRESKLLKDAVLVLDGFTDFTPIQYTLLRELICCAKDVYVSLTLDDREKLESSHGVQDLFYLSKNTIARLRKLAGDCHVMIQEPVILGAGENSRFAGTPMLQWLEHNLFREGAKPWESQNQSAVSEVSESGESSEIRMCSLANPRQELLWVAAELRRLVQEEQCRYRDIAIVCGDIELYGSYVPEIFDSYGIPYFLDRKNSISFHPLTELVKSVLQVAEQDFSYESILAYLRSGLTGISRQETDLLENYLLANRIRGRKWWKENWVRRSGVADVEELQQVNEIRKSIMELLDPAMESLRLTHSTVKDKTMALYELLVQLQVQQQLEERRLDLETQGRLTLAREYAQIYRIVMDLLDKFTKVLGQEQMDVRQYRQILEAGFQATSIGVIPPGYDQVLVGDTQRTRLPDIKILFLVGVNDGLIPKTEKSGGLLSQRERELLNKGNIELAPGLRDRAFLQRFHLYLKLTKASEKVYITWHRNDGEGKESRKSYLVGMLCRLFPQVKVERREELTDLSQVVTPIGSRRLLAEGLQKAREGQTDPAFIALLAWYRQQEEWRPQVEQLLNAAYHTYQGEFLTPEITRALYGQVLENSVTRLERFAACAYAHFIAYGIGVKERKLGEFAPVDMGSLFHGALEHYSVELENRGYTWADTPEEQVETLMEKAIQDTVAEAGYLLYQDARTAYTIQRIRRILRTTIDAIGSQLGESGFQPEGYEVAFTFAQDLESMNFQLSPKEEMRLRGRIDRVDARHQDEQVYVKVVDYKSGNTDFQLISLYHGLQLQLVVYMNAAVELLKRKYPDKEVLPAGMYYYHIDDPIVSVKQQTEPEEVRAKILEQLRLKGIGSQEDASVSKKGQRASSEELELLSEFVNTKIQQLGTQIFQGDIQVNPYAMKNKTGCDYCPYRSICGFDRKLEGYGYRRLENIKDEEKILERIREEVANGSEIHRGTAAGDQSQE